MLISPLRFSLDGMVYPDFVPVSNVSVARLAQVEEEISRALAQKASRLIDTSAVRSPERVHIYVCTHGSRDCRCGDVGEPLYQAINKEIARRKVRNVKVARVAHIGGHKWAGNALVYRDDGKADW